jgi:hypothetical protein
LEKKNHVAIRRNKDQSGFLEFFRSYEKKSSQKKDLVIRRNKHVEGYLQKIQTASAWSDQNARAWQLRDLEFIICKFMIKTHIRDNFMN